jgi:NitT/TauT family transport system substrate-binding protein
MDTQGPSASFIEYGESLGIFANHGIDLDFQSSIGGAATLPALMSGDIDVAGSGVTSVIQGVAQGFDLRFIAPGVVATSVDGEHSSTLVVAEDSDITDVSQLEGRTVAVSTLNSFFDLPVMAAADNAGINSGAVEFIEFPLPDIEAAVASGQVDAGVLIEPFQSRAEQAGLRAISYPYEEIRPGLQIAAYIGTSEYIDDHPELVQAFQAAVTDIVGAIDDDPEAFRSFMVDYTELPADLADVVALPAWSVEGDPDSWPVVADLMVEHGFIESYPDLDSLGVH